MNMGIMYFKVTNFKHFSCGCGGDQGFYMEKRLSINRTIGLPVLRYEWVETTLVF